jgi:hypothetical protein
MYISNKINKFLRFNDKILITKILSVLLKQKQGMHQANIFFAPAILCTAPNCIMHFKIKIKLKVIFSTLPKTNLKYDNKISLVVNQQILISLLSVSTCVP